MTETQAAVTLAISIASLIGLVAGWVKWARPRLRHASREITAVRDSILGRDAIVDSITGQLIAPALPGIGVRLAGAEEHLGNLAGAVERIAVAHEQLENHETRITRGEDIDEDHEARIKRLEEASVERIVTRAEAAASWRAIEEAVKAQPDVTVDDDPK